MHLSEIWHSKKNDSRLSRTQVYRYGCQPFYGQGVQGGRKLPIQQLGDSRLRLRLSLTDAGGKQEDVSQTWLHPPARRWPKR